MIKLKVSCFTNILFEVLMKNHISFKKKAKISKSVNFTLTLLQIRIYLWILFCYTKNEESILSKV